MVEGPLLYLGYNSDPQWHSDTLVAYQHHASEAVREISLGEALQLAGATLRVVVACSHARLTHVSLSRKQARHLQRVLPYLLEDQLLEAPDSLWFATRKEQGDTFAVTAVPRERINQLLVLAQEQQVTLTSLQVDADCLSPMMPVTAELSGTKLFALEREKALLLPASQADSVASLFADGLSEAAHLDGWSTFFDALRQGEGSELLTGPFVQRIAASGGSVLTPWVPFFKLSAAVFVCALLTFYAQAWRYGVAADDTLAQAKARYEALFPGDRASVALGRQFQAKLNRLGNVAEQGGGTVLSLLTPIATVLKQVPVSPKRLQLEPREGALILDVGAKDYAQLEALQAAIKSQGVAASIVNYRNGTTGINARLKVEHSS